MGITIFHEGLIFWNKKYQINKALLFITWAIRIFATVFIILIWILTFKEAPQKPKFEGDEQIEFAKLYTYGLIIYPVIIETVLILVFLLVGKRRS